MDSWYASGQVMAVIDQLGKVYYCPLKLNRRVDDTGGVEEYKRIDQLVGLKPNCRTANLSRCGVSKRQKGETVPG